MKKQCRDGTVFLCGEENPLPLLDIIAYLVLLW